MAGFRQKVAGFRAKTYKFNRKQVFGGRAGTKWGNRNFSEKFGAGDSVRDSGVRWGRFRRAVRGSAARCAAEWWWGGGEIAYLFAAAGVLANKKGLCFAGPLNCLPSALRPQADDGFL